MATVERARAAAQAQLEAAKALPAAYLEGTFGNLLKPKAWKLAKIGELAKVVREAAPDPKGTKDIMAEMCHV